MEKWMEQLQNRVNTLHRLKAYIHVTPEEEKAILTLNTQWGATPYFASLMDPNDSACPIRKQVVPSLKEMNPAHDTPRSLSSKENGGAQEVRPASIVQKVHDRAAFSVIDTCAVYCRHCFRKAQGMTEKPRLRRDVEEGLEWIADHEEIRDVLITGGDPFVLSDEKIEYLVRKLRETPHIRMIRFGTRLPIVLPQRITRGLLKVLGGFHRVPVWVSTQCNHPREITGKTGRAVFDLLRSGVNVSNQAVLLRGINDDVNTFTALHQKLLTVRIRPYTVFHCASAPGIDHFRTPVEKGLRLIRDGLRGHTTGLAQPIYVTGTRKPKGCTAGCTDGRRHRAPKPLKRTPLE